MGKTSSRNRPIVAIREAVVCQSQRLGHNAASLRSTQVLESTGEMTEERRLLTGIWSGLLDTGSLRLRLKFVIDEEGATLFSLDQGSAPIPGNIGVLTEERVKIDFPSVKGDFEGRVVAPNRVEGMWSQGRVDLFLALEKGDVEFAAAPPPHALTNERLAELRARARSPALAAASQRGASRTHIWVTGERAIGTAIAAKESDRWHLGSITKSMTATLVGVLVDLGAINWDETIGEILGTEIPDLADAYTSVTFRHLLCHRSGLSKDIPGRQIELFRLRLPMLAKSENLGRGSRCPCRPRATKGPHSNIPTMGTSLSARCSKRNSISPGRI